MNIKKWIRSIQTWIGAALYGIRRRSKSTGRPTDQCGLTAARFQVDGNPRFAGNRQRLAELRNHSALTDAIWRREVLPILRQLNGLNIELPGDDGERVAADWMALSLALAGVVAKHIEWHHLASDPLKRPPDIRCGRVIDHVLDHMLKRGAPTITLDRIEVPAHASVNDEWVVLTENTKELRDMYTGESSKKVWSALVHATNQIGEPHAFEHKDKVHLNVTRLRPEGPVALPKFYR